MKQNCDPEKMRERARLLWKSPGARERYRLQRAVYWSDPANRDKASREIRQRFARNPDYAKNVSEGKKRQHRENPDVARRHSEWMKNRFAQNPELLNEMGERTLESYRKDPTLAARMGQARKKFYESNPEARARSAEIARDLAKRRRALHDELESLAATYHSRTGKPFPLPTRSEGGWQEAVMLGIMEQLTGLLADGGK